MELPNIPINEPITDKTVTDIWISWFLTIWQRVSEPWKTDEDYQGQSTLVAGTIVVSAEVLTNEMNIILSPITSSGNAGFLSYTLSVNLDPILSTFTITSSNGSDDRTIYFELREPTTERT